MLSNARYDESLTIPLTQHTCAVDRNGKVYDSHTGDVYESRTDSNGMVVVDVPIDGIETTVPVALLVVSAFKRPHIPTAGLLKLTFSFLNGDMQDLHPLNIVYHPPIGGLEVEDHPGFYYIPGITRYGVNKDGQILSLKRGTIKNATIQAYHYHGFSNDMGVRVTLGLHRAMALAFIPYPPDVDRLIVNHKDGDKYNNTLDNLEWMTRSQNHYHAVEAGLFEKSDIVMNEVAEREYGPNSEPILVKDIRDGKVWRYPGVIECFKATRLSPERIHTYVNLKELGVRRRYFIFKYEKDPRDWPSYSLEDVNKWISGVAKQVILRDIRSKDLKIFESGSAAAKYLDASMESVMFQVERKRWPWPFMGYDIQIYRDGKRNVWPEWTDEEVAFFGDRIGLKRPIVSVNAETGVRGYFGSSEEAAEALGLNPSQIKNGLRIRTKSSGYYFHTLLFDETTQKTVLSTHKNEVAREKRTLPTNVVVRDINTGVVTTLDRFVDAAEKLGVRTERVLAWARDGIVWPLAGFDVRLQESVPDHWPEWTIQEKEFFKTYQKTTAPFVSLVDGKIIDLFEEHRQVSEQFGLSKSMMFTMVNTGRVVKGIQLKRLAYDSDSHRTVLYPADTLSSLVPFRCEPD